MTYLERFHREYPNRVFHMSECSHHYWFPNFRDDDHVALNPWHMEGDVWSHTMMVHKMSEDRTIVPQLCAKVLGLATLLHDAGKPLARKENDERQRVSFHGHAGISTLMAVDFLNRLGDEITQDEFVDIVRVINLHHTYMDYFGEMSQKMFKKISRDFVGNSYLLSLLQQHMICDGLGRFSVGEGGYATSRDDAECLKNNFNNVLWKMKAMDEIEIKGRPMITVMVGIPCSGKSTWVDSHRDGYDIILCRDDIVMELSDTEDYNEAFETVDQKAVDNLFNQRLDDAIASDKNILVDRTHVSKKSRNKLMARVPRKYVKEAVVMLTGWDTINTRNATRINKSLPQEVLLKMAKGFSIPMFDEFDFVQHIRG